MNGLKPNRMLVILAHPDDESFAVGGTLARYAHEGIQVVLLTATRGEIGIPDIEPETAAAIRELELEQAVTYLGAEIHFLGYRDGELSKTDPWKLLENVACWIDTVQPQVILTFGPDGVSGHPDHVAISNIVTQAVERFFPEVCLLYIAPSEATELGCGVQGRSAAPEETLISVDITNFKIDKIHAIQSHASQRPPLTGKAEEEVEKVPCHEYFTVAHTIKHAHDLTGCFEVEEKLTS